MILLVGNWKMAPDKPADALTLAKKVLATARQYKKTIQIVVCTPFIHMSILTKAIKTGLQFGGQGVASSESIAQTGIVSAAMLKGYGMTYCLVGHSEERARGITSEQVQASTLAILQKKIVPIICVGEKERDGHGWYLSTIKDQVESIVSVVPKAQLKQLVFAYEPLWAIGKDAAREATPAECREMVIFIQKVISDAIGEKMAKLVPILYGGSVNEENGASFIIEGGASGLLPGRLSLDAKRFGALAKSLSIIST